MNKKLIATTLFGLEAVLADELESIGATEVQSHNRAVAFMGDKAMMYRANYHLRTALRVLLPLRSFPSANEKDIYRGVHKLEWEKLIDPSQLIAVDTVLLSKHYRHSGFVSQRVKDAIVDRIREKKGSRPSVDLRNPDVRINIHLTDSHCSVSLDSSGESLHKRGYRTQNYQAPLNEVLAAGMIRISGWDAGSPFLNPMCGSGTLSIEAGMIARALPGGYFRNGFGFQRWKDFDPVLFESVRKERYLKENPDSRLIASDISPEAIRACQQNLASAGMMGRVELNRADFLNWKPDIGKGILFMNPPYGERISESDLPGLYKSIGDTLKHHFDGYDAWLLSGNPEAMKFIELKPGKKYRLFNGQIPCKFQKYELYKGSRKNVNKTGGGV